MSRRIELTHDETDEWRAELLRQVASGYSPTYIASLREAITETEAWGQVTSEQAEQMRELLDEYERSRRPN